MGRTFIPTGATLVKNSLFLLLALVVVSAMAQSKPSQGKSALTSDYIKAAREALADIDDQEFHALRYARDVAAKTIADKLSAKRLQAFITIHATTVVVSKSMFADQDSRKKLEEQEECRVQWDKNLRWRDPQVPAICGIKF